MKKIIIVSLILFQVSYSNAQMRGQHKGQKGQGQSQMQGGQKPTLFSSEKFVGILNFDNVKVIKKLKLKDEKKKQQLTVAISEHNKTMDNLKFINFTKFKEVDLNIARKRKDAMANRDKNAMRSAQDDTRELLMPIKKQVKKADNLLNSKLENILSEKQYKKWLKYQSAKKRALKPKQQSESKGKGKGSGKMGGGRNKMFI